MNAWLRIISPFTKNAWPKMGQPDVYQTDLAIYRRRITIKAGQLTLASQVDGQIPWANRAGLGLYHKDTRFLSGWELLLNGARLLSLFSSAPQSPISQTDLANPKMRVDGRVIPMHTIHLRVSRVIQGDLYQRLRIVNFNSFPITVKLEMVFGADFADIFEVRGAKRPQRGRYLAPQINGNRMALRYEGRDHLLRETQILFKPAPQSFRRISGRRVAVTFQLRLQPKVRRYLYLGIRPQAGNPQHQRLVFERVVAQTRAAARRWQRGSTQITVDNDVYQQMLLQAQDDLRILTTTYSQGVLPVAGLPWYDCPFGRDSLIAGWQTLILRPKRVVSTLEFLASYQGRQVDSWRDEEPGKILHELRSGEMAQSGEVPHTPYYGTVDATLLFIMVLGRLDSWLRDPKLIRKFEAPLRQALRWIEQYGDADGDGFVEYQRLSSKGLGNQCWKDSHDGILDEHGRDPKTPIALVEIQAYLYDAYIAASRLLSRLGDQAMAKRCQQRAKELQRRFLEQFWSDERGELAFGLDGKKRPFFASVSNMGQALASGILPARQARGVIRRLFQPQMYSGWGIRTRSSKEPAYNPMSYHNGSVWPHDNAIIAEGLRRYGALNELDTLLTGFFDAAVRLESFRLPELFCGFVRRGGSAPVIYPSACSPQAWAAGSVFQMLQAMLGIRVEAGRLFVAKPILPHWLKTVRLRNLHVGKGAAELVFERKASGAVRCRLIRKRGPIQVSIYG